MAFIAGVNFSIKLNEWIDSIDRNIVFLSKHANLPPEWVEEQDIVRQNRLIKITIDFIKAQRTNVETTDNVPEWQ